MSSVCVATSQSGLPLCVEFFVDVVPLAIARPIHQGWPAVGAVKLEGIKMRYRAGLDLVLKGVSLDIKVCVLCVVVEVRSTSCEH